MFDTVCYTKKTSGGTLLLLEKDDGDYLYNREKKLEVLPAVSDQLDGWVQAFQSLGSVYRGETIQEGDGGDAAGGRSQGAAGPRGIFEIFGRGRSKDTRQNFAEVNSE